MIDFIKTYYSSFNIFINVNFNLFIQMKSLFIFLVLLLSVTFNAQISSDLYAFNKDSEFFYKIDTNSQINFTTIQTDTLFSSIGNVNGVLGADTDPCGNVFVVYNSIQGRNLARVNLNTGILTDIGTLNIDGVANISFDNNGILYAVTGDGSTIGETLFTVDTSSAVMTQILTLGNGLDGESIEYNMDDNYLYHWSGWGSSNFIMEKINLSNLSITNVSLSGPGSTVLENVGASTYAGNGQFIVYDISQGLHFMIDTSGYVSNSLDSAGQYNYSIKGLMFPKEVFIEANQIASNPIDTLCLGDTITANIYNFDSSNVSSYQWFVDGIPASNLSINPSVFQFIPSSSSLYNIGLTITYNCSNAISSNQLNYTVNNIPNVNLNPSLASFCSGDSILLTGSGGGSSQWFVFNQVTQNYDSISGANSSSYYATIPGSYNMQKTNQNGCSAMANNPVSVSENTNPLVTISSSINDTLCVYDGACSITSSPNGAIFSGNGIIINALGDTDFDPSIAGIGAHIITATYTDSNGCIGVDSLIMHVDGCSFITEADLSNIILSPNPNNGNFVINGLKQNQFYTINDLQGKEIYSGIVKVGEKAQITGIDPGTYYLILKDKDTKNSIRFIVLK